MLTESPHIRATLSLGAYFLIALHAPADQAGEVLGDVRCHPSDFFYLNFPLMGGIPIWIDDEGSEYIETASHESFRDTPQSGTVEGGADGSKKPDLEEYYSHRGQTAAACLCPRSYQGDPKRSDPTGIKKQSRFKIVSICAGPKGGGVELTWTSEFGGSYTLQRSSDLHSWSPVLVGIPGLRGHTSALDAQPPAASKKAFYRIVKD